MDARQTILLTGVEGLSIGIGGDGKRGGDGVRVLSGLMTSNRGGDSRFKDSFFIRCNFAARLADFCGRAVDLRAHMNGSLVGLAVDLRAAMIGP